MTDNYTPEISADQILRLADDFIKTASNRHSALEGIVGLLKANFPYYNWVGIYLLENDDSLILGPYRGEPSPHTRIKTDSGICGAAVREEKTIIVPDVNKDPRYLACSLKTKSEIVVPIRKGKKIYGEIDIDSHKPDAFGAQDQQILESIASLLADLF